MPFTWESAMSEACLNNIAAMFMGRRHSVGSSNSNAAGKDIERTASGRPSRDIIDSLRVDDVLGSALMLMTSKLLRLYAFDAFSGGRKPDDKLVMGYVNGTQSTPALDYYGYPRLITDISAFKRMVLGSPMNVPTGMLVGICACFCSEFVAKAEGPGHGRRVSVKADPDPE